jgi:hypothetical protein
MEGTVVTYVDEKHESHTALINRVWKEDEEGPSYVNLVYVTNDGDKNDQYGRQIERATSVPRKDDNNAAGRHFVLV